MTGIGHPAMPAGVPNDSSPDDNLSATTDGAVGFAMGEMVEREAETHAQGSTFGDLMTLPGKPTIDNLLSADLNPPN